LLKLQLVVAFRRFDQDIGPEFTGAFLELIEIRLPALDFQGIHEKADFQILSRSGFVLRARRRNGQNQTKNQDKKRKDTPTTRAQAVHGCTSPGLARNLTLPCPKNKKKLWPSDAHANA
jgi:hypothetical protein